jgi:hypothetical protein
MVVQEVSAEHIAIRFEQIGERRRFRALLGRFTFDFPLATCQYRGGQAWWIMAAGQRDAIVAFAKQLGLRLVRE